MSGCRHSCPAVQRRRLRFRGHNGRMTKASSLFAALWAHSRPDHRAEAALANTKQSRTCEHKKYADAFGKNADIADSKHCKSRVGAIAFIGRIAPAWLFGR